MLLVGGRARRFAGIAKSELEVAGQTILERMLSACAAATERVVVGARPADAAPLPAGVLAVQEDPPGSGPALAAAAGLVQVGAGPERVAILPGDLPFLCPAAVELLRIRAEAAGPDSGAVFCDDAGRRQWLCGVWPTAAIRANATDIRPGDRAKNLFRDIEVETVHWDYSGPPPWFDCDTPADLEQARGWAADQK
ncbi:molybdenum cofactor guanylyltransferase [Glycomyces buryatensis]|uniref:Molybdenum cofactor guanylyltransferase n=1 Tax=Glycomyces buryatensis TaxID=2570927 RepID=A0A4S8QB05_9ACTN|nr:molybdenum cofactor guanylyltransferase [Glycomyces buryatensis]